MGPEAAAGLLPLRLLLRPSALRLLGCFSAGFALGVCGQAKGRFQNMDSRQLGKCESVEKLTQGPFGQIGPEGHSFKEVLFLFCLGGFCFFGFGGFFFGLSVLVAFHSAFRMLCFPTWFFGLGFPHPQHPQTPSATRPSGFVCRDVNAPLIETSLFPSSWGGAAPPPAATF